MARAAAPSAPVCLIHGDDDYAVKQRARQLYGQWCAELGGLDHEIIDGQVAHSGEALKAIAKLRETKADLTEDDYYQKLEGFLLEMARLYEQAGNTAPGR